MLLASHERTHRMKQIKTLNCNIWFWLKPAWKRKTANFVRMHDGYVFYYRAILSKRSFMERMDFRYIFLVHTEHTQSLTPIHIAFSLKFSSSLACRVWDSKILFHKIVNKSTANLSLVSHSAKRTNDFSCSSNLKRRQIPKPNEKSLANIFSWIIRVSLSLFMYNYITNRSGNNANRCIHR